MCVATLWSGSRDQSAYKSNATIGQAVDRANTIPPGTPPARFSVVPGSAPINPDIPGLSFQCIGKFGRRILGQPVTAEFQYISMNVEQASQVRP